MTLTLLALAAFIGWRMVSMHISREDADRGRALPLKEGMQAMPLHETYACNTVEDVARDVAFQVTGTQDKVRAQLERKECARIEPQQRLKIVALKDKLAEVAFDDAQSSLWMPARDLTPASGK